MKIATSDIQLQGNYSASKRLETQEKMRAWIGDQRPDFEGRRNNLIENRPTSSAAQSDQVQLSDAAKSAQTQEAQAITNIDDEIAKDPRYAFIKYLVELLTGRKITTLSTADMKASGASACPPAAANTDSPQATPAAAPPATKRAGWGVEIERHSSYTETEQSSFQASGTITTADNKTIEFNLSFNLQRSYHEESSEQIRLGDAKKVDPLILNFSGNSAQLTSQKFAFDLNADGKKENISFVQGSGFLAFDKNGDGKINDGSELFGPGTGNGFAELAAYDSDGNHWIDENDAVYQKLQVWTKDGSGKDQLQSLKQANVGALYLGNVSTPFELKNSQNQSDGQLRASGLWLTEDGKAKTMQQVDLVV
ncbi:hypothetical protein [Undibacterium danionis]|uniref:VCBS repeat-containing protein n=1 Tax=Undibacterium danionis TaxID=1812100 RepID=A0ABV6I8P9_9BURK